MEVTILGRIPASSGATDQPDWAAWVGLPSGKLRPVKARTLAAIEKGRLRNLVQQSGDNVRRVPTSSSLFQIPKFGEHPDRSSVVEIPVESWGIEALSGGRHWWSWIVMGRFPPESMWVVGAIHLKSEPQYLNERLPRRRST